MKITKINIQESLSEYIRGEKFLDDDQIKHYLGNNMYNHIAFISLGEVVPVILNCYNSNEKIFDILTFQQVPDFLARSLDCMIWADSKSSHDYLERSDQVISALNKFLSDNQGTSKIKHGKYDRSKAFQIVTKMHDNFKKYKLELQELVEYVDLYSLHKLGILTIQHPISYEHYVNLLKGYYGLDNLEITENYEIRDNIDIRDEEKENLISYTKLIRENAEYFTPGTGFTMLLNKAILDKNFLNDIKSDPLLLKFCQKVQFLKSFDEAITEKCAAICNDSTNFIISSNSEIDDSAFEQNIDDIDSQLLGSNIHEHG